MKLKGRVFKVPERKISETILEFGEPIIDVLSPRATKEEFAHIMQIVVSAWNAVVLDEWNDTSHFESGFLAAFDSAPPQLQAMAADLVLRKKKKFSDDPRGVGKYEVLEKHGQLVFRADARLDL